ncbi:MAG: NAD(P)-dependent alcohol dehydrogenase [Cyclobacteriaceae bacterium]
MKAIINDEYGSPDILELREIERPIVKKKQVLVKVLAASVNKADWFLLHGEPFMIRMMAGLFKPKFRTLGADVAGVVERVGPECTQFKPGDEVFGDLSGGGFGGFAEYVAADENRLSKRPPNLTYEQAAALPMAAVTALQGLRDQGGVGKDDHVLINGASGGVGGFAIQIAKYFGAKVTAVCSTSKLNTAIEQGADEVIDYQKVDFIQSESQYDLIFDVVGNHSIRDIDRVLIKGGSYVSCAFSMEIMFLGPIKSMTQRKKYVNLMSKSNQEDLQFICKLAEEGFIVPVVDRTFTLDDVAEALWIIGKGAAAGKLVVSV